MSVIDSAIIKTLVEHMSSNTEASTELFDNLKSVGTFTKEGSDFVYEGELGVGYLWRMKHIPTNTIKTWICTYYDYSSATSEVMATYSFFGGKNDSASIVISGDLRIVNLRGEYEEPDNVNTGMFRIEANNTLDTASPGSLLSVLLTGLRAQTSLFMDAIDDLCKQVNELKNKT